MLDRFLTTLRTLLERLLLVWLTLLGGAAFFWSDWFPRCPNPFLEAIPIQAKLFFAVTMLAIGSLLPRDEVRQLVRRWPTVLSGTAIQYVSMPILAWCLGRLFHLDGPWMVGVILVGCVPGAMASNVLTLAARGNVSYSLSLTTSATLLSPLLVPIALWFGLSGLADYSPGEIRGKVAVASAILLGIVVLPVVVGYGLSRASAAWEATAQRIGAIVANLTILWIIANVVAENRDNFLDMDRRILPVLLLVNLGGYLAGSIGSFLLRLRAPMRRALTLEIGMQNAGLGVVLADAISDYSEAKIAPAIFTFGCMFTGTVLARVWAEWDRRDKPTTRDPSAEHGVEQR